MLEQTCEAAQKELTGALTRDFVVIGQHGKGKASLVQRVTTNDAQVVQRDPGCGVEGDEHIAAYFFYRL